ncbi:hypothetical protein AY599_11080 [Leptolyngbya valderiana BDU 20041]|nr:hypothetical protein AY599_11080 [Leptolyngbya valderiana BDU 20041]
MVVAAELGRSLMSNPTPTRPAKNLAGFLMPKIDDSLWVVIISTALHGPAMQTKADRSPGADASK